MTDAWPETLPQCFNVGFSEGLPDNTIESQPEIGPPMSRPRSSLSVRPLSGEMRMTRAQIMILKSFFETTVSFGALPFEFPNPHDPSGDPLLVKFQKGGSSWTQVAGGIFRVPLSFLVMP